MMQEEEQQKEVQAAAGEPDSESPREHVSAFRNAREIEARERREADLKERARQKREEEAAYQAREEYAKELHEDKVDLIRLKQGVITDSDKVFPEQEAPKKYTVWQKIGNWFYHSKWWLGIAVFCTLVGAFLVYDFITRKDPDVSVLILTDNVYVYNKSDELCAWLQDMCEDYNGDGKKFVQSVYIPVSKAEMESGSSYASANNTQLMVQMETSICMLVMANDEAADYLQPELIFEDMERLYPDCPYAEGYKLKIAGTAFEEIMQLDQPLTEDTYLALRIPVERMSSLEEMKESYDHAKKLLDVLVPQLDAKGGAAK